MRRSIPIGEIILATCLLSLGINRGIPLLKNGNVVKVEKQEKVNKVRFSSTLIQSKK